MSRRDRIRLKEFFVPAALFGVVALSGGLGGHLIDHAAEQRFVDDLEQSGTVTAFALRQFMREQETAITHMARTMLPLEIELQGGAVDAQYIGSFQRLGTEIADWLTAELGVNWVGPDGTIMQVVPFGVNQEARGKNLLEHPIPEVRGAFERALSSGRASAARCEFTPLIELFQGGRGFAVYRPVFARDGHLAGVLNVAYRLSDVFEARIPSDPKPGNADYAILGPDGMPLYVSHPDVDLDDWDFTSDLPLDLLDEDLTLRVGPTPEWQATGLAQVGQNVTLWSTILAALVASLSFSTGRKRLQKEEADLRLGLALEGARLGVWDLDVASGELHLNELWMAMLGLDPEEGELSLEGYRELVHPDDRERVRVAMEEHLTGATDVYSTQHRLRAGDGGWVWVLDTGRVVARDASGRPERVAGTQTNISETQAAKEALELSLQRYRSIFQNSPVGMVEQNWSTIKTVFDELRVAGIDDLGAYLEEHPSVLDELAELPQAIDANPAFHGLFQAEDQAGLRRNLERMVDARARAAYARGLSDLYASGQSCGFDVALTGLDGQQLLYSVRAVVAPGSEHDFGSVFVSVVDNTRRLREEQQRRAIEERDRRMHKDESLALLAGGVAHDFNNLLVPIIGSIELALGESDAGSNLARNLRRAEQASLRAADLARQMLIYSGRGQVQSEVFDLTALVREMTHLLETGLPGKVELEAELGTAALGLEGDPTQFRQLVMNLVINAADAVAEESGTVYVRTGLAVPSAADLEGSYLGEGLVGKECAFLEVQDTGRGLDDETLKRMFEPFFSTKASGRGLGMSVVLGIVRGHGGALQVDSQLGVGTRIRALLPRTELSGPVRGAGPQQRPIPLAELGAEPPSRAPRVLLADDELQVQSFVEEALGRLGYEVVCVGNGEEALEAWRTTTEGFDLLLLDATMPRLGGVEAMEVVRATDEHQPIVLASGYTEHEITMHVAEKALTWFLPKPFGLGELVQVVRAALDEGRAARDGARVEG